jgi:hypothetical protein
MLPLGTGWCAVNVTDYLERARECAAMAARKTGDEKQRLNELAEAWLKLAQQQAEAATAAFGKVPEYPKPK